MTKLTRRTILRGAVNGAAVGVALPFLDIFLDVNGEALAATGQRLREDASALDVLRTAVRRSGYRRKRKQWAGTNRGIGLALYWHGSGFTGSGELKLASRATVELTATVLK